MPKHPSPLLPPPPPPESEEGKLLRRIQHVLDPLRPHLWADDGDVQILSVDLKNSTLYLALIGECQRCPYVSSTLQTIEQVIRQAVPEVQTIRIVQKPPEDVRSRECPSD